MSYWLSKAGTRLRAEVDKAHPKRSRVSDGWIGDASHAAVPSDHNPCWTCSGTSRGVVRALDLTHDPKGGFDAHVFANWLAGRAKKGKVRGRVSYIISNGRIASGTHQSSFWTWRPYSGSNPHSSHVHVSFTPAGDLDEKPFSYARWATLTVESKRLASLIKRVRVRLAELRGVKADVDKDLGGVS